LSGPTRASIHQGGGTSAVLQGLKTHELDQRSKTIVYIFVSESKYLENMRVANRVLVKPLEDLTKGASLNKATQVMMVMMMMMIMVMTMVMMMMMLLLLLLLLMLVILMLILV
jgi:uncharacterized membrane protein YbaN (DUF454 family)